MTHSKGFTPLDLEFPGLYNEIPYDTLLWVITRSLEVMVHNWQQLYDAVRKECDGENVSFMNSEQYVHLLYDDSTFRRSRLYFWAIGCLSAFTQSIPETLWELGRFQAEVEKKIIEIDENDHIYTIGREAFGQEYRRLQYIHVQMVENGDELKVLREAVCNIPPPLRIYNPLLLSGWKIVIVTVVTKFRQHRPYKMFWVHEYCYSFANYCSYLARVVLWKADNLGF